MSDPGTFSIDAMLCDSAVVAEGKLYVHGAGWNMLSSSQFPFVQSRIGLAVVIGVPYTETNREHRLHVRLESEDGDLLPLGPPVPDPDQPGGTQRATGVGAQFNVGRPPMLQPGDRQNLPFAINLDQLGFERSGAYSCVLTIDGEEVNRLPFRVQATRG
jgi:hypothetical protein